METTESEYLTIKQAAELRGLKFVTLYQWCYDGKIPTIRNGPGSRAGYLLRLTDLDHFLEAPRGSRTVMAMQARNGERAALPQTAPVAAATGSTQRPATSPTSASSAVSSVTPPVKKRKSAVLSSKDHMRKLSVPEMVDIINWLSNRIGMQWDAKGMVSPSPRPEVKTSAPMPHSAED